MESILKWFGGFFNSKSNNSSKRLVGIIGAGFLYYSMYMSVSSDKAVSPSDALVYSVTALVAISLGLTTIEALRGLITKDRSDDRETY
jgi:hypothetical protein